MYGQQRVQLGLWQAFNGPLFDSNAGDADEQVKAPAIARGSIRHQRVHGNADQRAPR